MECVEGKWEAMVCQGGTSCYATGDGLDGYETQDIVCGECKPGVGICDGNGDRVICGEDGQYGDPEPCDSGSCIVSYDGISGDDKAVCGFTCVPGTKQCNGLTQERTCLEDGTWGSDTDCTGNTQCRQARGSVILGCVECVGTQNINYYGPDSECDVDGMLRTCQSDHTWGAPVACSGSLECAETSANNGTPYGSYLAACQEPAPVSQGQ